MAISLNQLVRAAHPKPPIMTVIPSFTIPAASAADISFFIW